MEGSSFSRLDVESPFTNVKRGKRAVGPQIQNLGCWFVYRKKGTATRANLCWRINWRKIRLRILFLKLCLKPLIIPSLDFVPDFGEGGG